MKAPTKASRNYIVATTKSATVSETVSIQRIVRKNRTASGMKEYLSRDWYTRIMRGGKRPWINLGPDQDAAARRALQLKRDAAEGGLAACLIIEDAANEPSGHPVTIGELLDLLLLNRGMFEKATPSTLKTYAASLLLILRETIGEVNGRIVTDEEVREIPASILCGKTVYRFRDLRLLGPDKQPLAGARLDSAKRTTNRHLRNARALVNPSVIAKLREQGHNVPDFTEFKAAPLAQNTRVVYRLPEPQTIVKVACAIHAQLRRSQGNSDYIAALLALHAGLRREEITHARWDWIIHGKRVMIVVARDDGFVPKHDQNRRVQISRWLYQELMKFKPADSFHSGRDYVLQGRSRAEIYAGMSSLTDWLRREGVTAEKPIHELRKWFGAFFAGTFGITTAQRQLGHTTPLVTNDHYAGIDHFNEELGQIWEDPSSCQNHDEVMRRVRAAEEEDDDESDTFGFRREERLLT